MKYRLTYCRDDYTLADAFRPNPRWGKKIYSADLECAMTDDELIGGAKDTAPEGYWLQCLEAIGGEPHVRVVYQKSVPGCLSAQAESERGE